jgi:hypothetical protein
MAISFVGANSGLLGATGAASWTAATWQPASLANGDLLFLIIETANQTGMTVGGTGAWTNMGAAGFGVAGAVDAAAVTVFWKRYNSATDNVNLTITDPGDHTQAKVLAFRGVRSSGNPGLLSLFNAANTGTGGAGSIATTPSSYTTTGNNTEVIVAVAYNATDASGSAVVTWTDGSGQFANVGGSFELTDDQGLTGNGGGISVAAGRKNIVGQLTTTITAAWSSRPGGIFLLDLQAEGQSVLSGLGTLGAVTGAAVVQLRTNVTISGASLQAVTGAAVVENEESGVDATIEGLLAAVTGAAEVEFVALEITAAGELAAVTGEVVTELTMEATVAGLLAAVEGAVDMTNHEQQDAALAGVLAAVEGAAVVDLTMEHTVTGTLGAVIGEGEVELIMEVTLNGLLNPISAVAEIEIEKACYTVELDTRERILARLDALIATVPGVVRSKRNDPEIPEDLVPAALLLDSDEGLNDAEHNVRNRPAFAPRIMDMTPELYIMLTGEPVQAGKDLNELHDEVVSLVLHDADLLALTLDGKGIRYDGARADFDVGRSQDAEMALDFTFTYYLNPEPLCEPLDAPVDPWLPDDGIRERILAAMARALEECEGIATFKRNEVVTNVDALPAVMMLDGDEYAHEPDSGKGRAAHQPKRVRMEPEVYLIVNQSAALVGPKLNQLRFMVIRSVLNDSLLGSLCHNFDLRYEGCQTGLSLGRSMAGEMGLKFTATYVLNP